MTTYSRNLNQSCTYWARTGVDGFNKPSFSAPVLIDCRWQDSSEMVTNQQGEKVNSNAVVIVGSVVNYGGYIQLGDFTGDATPFESSDDIDKPFPIISILKTPTLSGAETIIKAVL